MLYRTNIVAVHDEQGTGDFLCVVYRVEAVDRSRLAWEASIMFGSPYEQFRDAYRHMVDRCAQLNAQGAAA